jgi:hypothetical protein
MTPEELIPGERYRLKEGLEPSIEVDLEGTDRIVELANSIPSCNEYTFMWRNYTDCIATVRAENIDCWVPRVGELAEFSDDGKDWHGPHEFSCYLSDESHSFRLQVGYSYKYARPVQQPKDESQPDRKYILEAAKLEAMRNALKPESHEPLYGPTELNTGHDANPSDPRYADLKRRLMRLERLMADIMDLHKSTGDDIDDQLRCLKNQQETAGANMLVLLQELTVRLEVVELAQKQIGIEALVRAALLKILKDTSPPVIYNTGV